VEWRKLHNEELHDLYCPPTILRVMKSIKMRWAGYVVLMADGRGVYRVLVGKPEGKRQPERPRRRWEDNMKPLTPELNPSAQRCLPRFFTGEFNF
jgi:hypothetical protein